jgi:hypothetical protein
MKDADLCRVIDTIGQHSAESFSTLKGLQFEILMVVAIVCSAIMQFFVTLAHRLATRRVALGVL